MKTLSAQDKDFLLSSIRDVPDFPKPGIIFKDITTLLNNQKAFNFLMDHLVSRYEDKEIDFIAGIESRGFIFGTALAARLRNRFVPVRKQGKLPYTTIGEKYSLEYGFDEIEIHIDAFGENGCCSSTKEKSKVLLIDDLIATAANLINKAGAKCIEACFIINLAPEKGCATEKDL